MNLTILALLYSKWIELIKSQSLSITYQPGINGYNYNRLSNFAVLREEENIILATLSTQRVTVSGNRFDDIKIIKGVVNGNNLNFDSEFWQIDNQSFPTMTASSSINYLFYNITDNFYYEALSLVSSNGGYFQFVFGDVGSWNTNFYIDFYTSLPWSQYQRGKSNRNFIVQLACYPYTETDSLIEVYTTLNNFQKTSYQGGVKVTDTVNGNNFVNMLYVIVDCVFLIYNNKYFKGIFSINENSESIITSKTENGYLWDSNNEIVTTSHYWINKETNELRIFVQYKSGRLSILYWTNYMDTDPVIDTQNCMILYNFFNKNNLRIKRIFVNSNYNKMIVCYSSSSSQNQQTISTLFLGKINDEWEDVSSAIEQIDPDSWWNNMSANVKNSYFLFDNFYPFTTTNGNDSNPTLRTYDFVWD